MAILDFIPENFKPRDKQVKALDFIERAIANGFVDIVIEAPTGVGKSLIAVAAAYYGEKNVAGDGNDGGIILTHQKMLQDQYARSFPNELVSLKSSTEYPCPTHKTCAMGMMKTKADKPVAWDTMSDEEKEAWKLAHPPKCHLLADHNCLYRIQKELFLHSTCGLTNYAYFFTERQHVREIKKRRLLILDEAHLLERQIISHVDAKVNETTMERYSPGMAMPKIKELAEFVVWIEEEYVFTMRNRLDLMCQSVDPSEEEIKKAAALEQHINKMAMFITLVKKDPKQWVFWEDKDSEGKRELIARPINAAPFFPGLIGKAGDIRIYLSAFPGVKSVFCRSLGLDRERVAWYKLGSSFPVENRPIYMQPVGSMSMRNKEKTTPALLGRIVQIATKRQADNGVIHCHSYVLGKAIYEHLRANGFTRLLFPRKAEERESAVKKLEAAANSDEKYILISPSVTEGFDFADDICRWQIIAKCPYMSMGDKQVVAKKDQDPEWYSMATIMTIIQAAGRVCRSDTDTGVTYILDSDVIGLYERNPDFFPKWFTGAIVWPKQR